MIVIVSKIDLNVCIYVMLVDLKLMDLEVVGLMPPKVETYRLGEQNRGAMLDRLP